MKMYGINRSQILPVSLEKAWQFFSSPINLPIITPPWLNLKITKEVAEPMFPGMIICFKLTPFFGKSLISGKNKQHDIVVVGGGIVDASTAWQLKQHFMRGFDG